MKTSKVILIREYPGAFKTKLTLADGATVKVPKGTKVVAGQTIGYTAHAKGDAWENIDGTSGTYENDFNKFEGVAGGMTLAKQEELMFLHSLQSEEA